MQKTLIILLQHIALEKPTAIKSGSRVGLPVSWALSTEDQVTATPTYYIISFSSLNSPQFPFYIWISQINLPSTMATKAPFHTNLLLQHKCDIRCLGIPLRRYIALTITVTSPNTHERPVG